MEEPYGRRWSAERQHSQKQGRIHRCGLLNDDFSKLADLCSQFKGIMGTTVWREEKYRQYIYVYVYRYYSISLSMLTFT
jgi:hypothetical protein